MVIYLKENNDAGISSKILLWLWRLIPMFNSLIQNYFEIN